MTGSSGASRSRIFLDGFTILNADGGWFDPQERRFIEEESRQILVCARKRAPLRAWCRDLGKALAQREFLVLEIGNAAKIQIGRSARNSRRFQH